MALMTRTMALMTRTMALMTRTMALMTRMTGITGIRGMTSLMTIQKSLMLGLTECFLAIHKFQIQYY
jgi:hypothetical protein